jgi:hypothetical protein
MERTEPAAQLECSTSKIGRIETGESGIRPTELTALLDLYQIEGQERTDLERLGAQTRQRRKRTTYGPALPDWFRRYVSWEDSATEVKIYDIELVPGIFQTEEYAEAVTSANPLVSPDDIERLVEARMARQRRLTGDDAIQVWTILNEGVLHRAGGMTCGRRQLERLRAVADLPNVTIQILPYAFGAHAATGFPFTLLRLPNADGLDVVYLEDMTSARYVDNDAAEQRRYAVVWDRLVEAALTPPDSADLLDTLIGEP